MFQSFQFLQLVALSARFADMSGFSKSSITSLLKMMEQNGCHHWILRQKYTILGSLKLFLSQTGLILC